jgi:hypothetical protein
VRSLKRGSVQNCHGAICSLFTTPLPWPVRPTTLYRSTPTRGTWTLATITACLRQTKRDFLMVSRTTGGIVWLPIGSETGVTPLVDKTRGESYMCRTTHKSELMPFSDFVAKIAGTPW